MHFLQRLESWVLGLVVLLPAGSLALTRCEVMVHGEAWVQAGILYSQGPGSSVCPGPLYADPLAGGGWYRPDCSGFVSAVWQLPAPGHTTYSFAGGPWDDGVSYVIDPADLQPGDAVNFGGNPSAGTGHIRLVGGWAAPGVLWGYEEIHCGQPAQYWEASWASMAGQYVAIRRVDIAECNAAPRGYVDGVDATHAVGWAQDTDSPDQGLGVHVYFGGPTGSASAVGVATTANIHRADLCTAIGSCAHGFDVAVPVGFRDGAPHPVHAYTFDSTSGAPVELPGSPAVLQAPPPALPSGVRRHVVDPVSFAAWHFSYPWVAREPDAAVSAVPLGSPFPSTPVYVQADDGTPEVWLVDGNERRHVIHEASAAAWKLDLSSVPRWPAAQVYALARGKPWRATPFVFMGSQGAVYVMDDPPAPPVVASADAGTPADGGASPAAGGGGSNAGQGDGGPGGEGPTRAADAGNGGPPDGGSVAAPGRPPGGCGALPAAGGPALWLATGLGVLSLLRTARSRQR